MFQNFRIKTASRFGKLEHTTAKILGLFLLGVLIYRYFTKQSFYLELIAFVLWLIYHISHRLEKFFYGKGLR